jgi:hypothetical protein
MGRIYEKRDSLSREIDHGTWEYALYTFERQPGKKRVTKDYQFKSCVLGQKGGLLTSGSLYLTPAAFLVLLPNP